MYYVIGASVPSLHRESTDSLITCHGLTPRPVDALMWLSAVLKLYCAFALSTCIHVYMYIYTMYEVKIVGSLDKQVMNIIILCYRPPHPEVS